jgi:uncharacterized membrane protein affecting hemolysin expression
MMHIEEIVVLVYTILRVIHINHLIYKTSIHFQRTPDNEELFRFLSRTK